MAINLVKGETLNLSKEAAGATKFELRAGWDVSYGTSMDIDIMAGRVSADGKGLDLVYYNNMKSKDGAVQLSGDNRTGEGDGWDETIYFDSTKLSSDVKTIPAFVSIYNADAKGQNFGLVRNLKVQIFDATNNVAVANFEPELEFGTATAVVLGEFVVSNGSMYFKPLAQPFKSVQDIVSQYGLR